MFQVISTVAPSFDFSLDLSPAHFLLVLAVLASLVSWVSLVPPPLLPLLPACSVFQLDVFSSPNQKYY